MNLESQLTALKNQSRNLTLAERTELSCRLARQFERAGEYDAACDALSEIWPKRHRAPMVEGLDPAKKAEVLLRVGALAGWLGSAQQAEGSQETAKNLITKSIETFEELGESEKVAEARSDLALCYWREGAFDEARVLLRQVTGDLENGKSEIRAIALIRSAIVEKTAARYNEALSIYKEAAPIVGAISDDALKGTFHNGLATLLNCRGLAENREDYIDQSLIEFAAASFHFERAGNIRYCALVENNLGFLFSTIGKFTEAQTHINRARGLFASLGDRGRVAQVDDTRARTLLAQGFSGQAERVARSAVEALERGDESSLLSEALTTYGTALARTGKSTRARAMLERAIEVAETTGDLEGAGRAKLSIIEELGEKIPAKEMVSIYRSTIDLLKHSQDPSTGKRLISCAAALLDVFGSSEGEDHEYLDHTWEGFSFKQQVLNYEKTLIERALRDAGGSVTRAARLLGFNHHQSLIALINSRHKDLLKTRSTVRKRRRHLFSEPRKIKKKIVTDIPQPSASQISILHVEDNKVVSRLIQDTLAPEGMHVDSCINGMTALEVLRSDAPYDALIVDNDLPGLSGLELVLRVRSMPHRRETPIIMLSGADCEKEAWRAGVSDFLRKPDDIEKISSTIARLLEERKKRTD
jgi:CheY-like chemotaxis protein